MNEWVFIDSDILVRFFAINREKRQTYESKGSTGDRDLDDALNLVKIIENNKQNNRFHLLHKCCRSAVHSSKNLLASDNF